MKNEMQVFNFNNKDVRVSIDDNGNPWWVAKDVCSILKITNVSQAVGSLDADEKAAISTTYISSNKTAQNRSILTVNEPGLYQLILVSRKPEAKEFKRWITHEVLPAIRKTGLYKVQQPNTNIEWAQQVVDMSERYIAAQEALIALEAENSALRPSAAVGESMLDKASKSESSLTDFFNLHRPRLVMNKPEFFKWMRSHKYLYLKGTTNHAYAKFIDRGYFVQRQVVLECIDSLTQEPKIVSSTRITLAGQRFILDKLMAAGMITSPITVKALTSGTKTKALPKPMYTKAHQGATAIARAAVYNARVAAGLKP
jgi:anti-repressor protein